MTHEHIVLENFPCVKCGKLNVSLLRGVPNRVYRRHYHFVACCVPIYGSPFIEYEDFRFLEYVDLSKGISLLRFRLFVER